MTKAQKNLQTACRNYNEQKRILKGTTTRDVADEAILAALLRILEVLES